MDKRRNFVDVLSVQFFEPNFTHDIQEKTRKKEAKTNSGGYFWQKLIKDIYSETEEFEKNRFKNTELGLVNCLNFTTLWHPKSSACNSCLYNNDCKEELKKKFVKLYNLRNGI